MRNISTERNRAISASCIWLMAGVAAIVAPGVAAAQGASVRPSLVDSFRLGTGPGVLCQMQSIPADPAATGMFDRAWSILCRDAAVPIGKVYALRGDAAQALARIAPGRTDVTGCGGSAPASVADIGGISATDCKTSEGRVDYRIYAAQQGRTSYVAEGLTGYDSALTLALRTIMTDSIVPGQVEVAVTSAGDPAAFARVQAGALDLETALAEGYRRNNSGYYAEAAEFFDTLLSRADADRVTQRQLGEYVVNRALQKSNLGEFAEADALFGQAAKIPTSDPVQLRLRRNFKAMHLINQRRLSEARAELDRLLLAIGDDGARATDAVIDPATATEINGGSTMVRALGAPDTAPLTPEEKAAILDAQALQLEGTIARLNGDRTTARRNLETALADLIAIRDGRVTSITRLRAQTMAEISAVAEAESNQAEAERLLREGLALLDTEYPQSIAVDAGKSRLAAYLARQGRTPEALTLYREVVNHLTSSGGATTGFENLLAPYFALLVREMPAQPDLVSDFFLASQTLVRPGVADTQAILARQLSGGSDDAARLFRQSVNLTRDIERHRIEYARLRGLPQPTADDALELSRITEALKTLEADQLATQAQLSQYPRYRAISGSAMTLADLRAVLRQGEAYVKLAVVGSAVYGLYVDQADATAWLTGVSDAALDKKVGDLRDTISLVVDGQPVTYPLDLKLARGLYVDLLQPVDTRLKAVDHLIFEPDGAMLTLPPNVLVTEQAGVDAYYRRLKRPRADEFDFTGIAWLGRRMEVSTAVSARGFADVRKAAPSAATSQYLGLGQNAPVSSFVQLTSSRSVAPEGGVDCNWPLAAWNRPIAATELNEARSIIGSGGAEVVTGAAFTDTGLLSRGDLDRFRIVHFATHGLVTAPRPECPARPALLTSFGDGQSDGLLTFAEVYNLKLDADIVILSACDTAGKASVAATREAGITVGGGSALDGLVRAFIGAGGRSVMASHWPLPDDFQATERLIRSLFESPAGTSIGDALRAGQLRLMDAAETSHPYYWAGFAIVGDGAQPVLKAN